MSPRFHIAGLAAAFLFAVSAAAQAQDTTAPELGSISISPTSVQVDSSPGTVDVTVAITDAESGFYFGNLFLYRPADGFVASIFFNADERIAGDAASGTYLIPVTVAQYSPPGTWRIGVLLIDNDSNRRDYGPDDDPFPVPGDETFTVTNPGTVDNAMPTIANLSLTPTEVDTGSGPRTVTLTFDLSDPLSGVRSGFVNLYDPDFNYSFSLSPFFDSFHRISGDAFNGTYEVEITLPQGSQAGDWTFDVFVRDQAGNNGFPTGGDGGFTVTNAGASTGDLSDATDATQYPWNTSGGGEWSFQTDVTYDGVDAARSGNPGPDGVSVMDMEVTGPGVLTFWWKVDSEESWDELSVEVPGTSEFDSISGDVDWEQSSVAIPPGLHTVRWSYSKDSGGDVGADAGWVDRVHFQADSDGEDPVVQGIRISPKALDVASGDQPFTIAIEVSDDSNGFDSGTVWIYDENGNEYDQYSFDSADLVSGDGLFGVYEIDAFLFADDVFPIGFYTQGIWRIEVEVSESGTSNTRYYSPFDEPFPNPGDETFVVGEGGDGGPPVLETVNGFTPDPVDAGGGATPVVVTFEVSDDDIGFDYGIVYLNNPDGGYVTGIFFDSADRVSGDDFQGTYSVSLPLPQYAPPGNWSVDFYLRDFDGNEADFTAAGQFAVTNSGTADTGDPALNSFTLTPAAVDASSGPASLTVDFNATDDLSGLQGIFLFVYDPSNNFQFTVSVDPASGVADDYTTTIEVPAGSAEGTWRVVVFLRDKVGNSSRYGLFGDPYPIPGSEEFTVGPLAGSTFANFMTPFGLTGPDALADGNPDHDPFPNGMELVLGLDPTQPDAADPAVYRMERTAGEVRIVFRVDPALSVQVDGDFLAIDDGGGSPFLLTGESATELDGSWTTQLPQSVGGTTYQVSLAIAPDGSGFLRLRGSDP
jgi:hypothetical protein